MRRLSITLLLLAIVAQAATQAATRRYRRYVTMPRMETLTRADTLERLRTRIDSLQAVDRPFEPLSTAYYGPAVFDRYHFFDSIRIVPTANLLGMPVPEATYWLQDEVVRQALMRQVRQQYFIDHPGQVQYNLDLLPEAPPPFTPTVDPRQHKFHLDLITGADAAGTAPVTVRVDRKNWLNTFQGSLQFSQSYLSPNWYQGGDGNLNAILSLLWDTQLNQAFHPRLMAQATVTYKLAMNNAPDDSLHRYNISEDLFKVTAKAGIKAWNRWYYSATLVFKTQFLNNYKKNANDLQAMFMAPGELNLGLGMTYNYVNPKATVTFDASVSPVSWNLKTCLTDRISPTGFGIKAGHRTASQIGTSAEGTLKWLIGKTVTCTSRLYAFTDYNYMQGDWENTLNFAFNRFISAQVYVHLRYDRSRTPVAGSRWRYWQLKEIFSLGFSYTFTSGV